MKNDPETPLLIGRAFLATANAVIDYRKAKIEIIMANVPLNDPNVDASAIVPAPDPEEEEEDSKKEEEDTEEDPEEEDDDVMEIDDEAEPIPPITSFGQNFHFGTAWKRLGKIEKLMSERIKTKGRMKKKFKEQDRHFVGLGCDNIEMDRAVRNVMSDLSRSKKLVKDLSDRFDEYEGSQVFKDKKVLEKELVNERIGRNFTKNSVNICVECSKIVKSLKIVFLCLLVRKIENHMLSPLFNLSLLPILMILITMPPRKSTRGNPPPPLTRDTVATLGIESVTRKTWAEMKVMMTKEFYPPKEIQRMECELWNLRVKDMDISFYTTRFNELMILCPGMVPMERKNVEAYIRGL
nr:hypothetical protein [Tanacetum cinerariifolium]